MVDSEISTLILIILGSVVFIALLLFGCIKLFKRYKRNKMSLEETKEIRERRRTAEKNRVKSMIN